jgi:hypothetical protein
VSALALEPSPPAPDELDELELLEALRNRLLRQLRVQREAALEFYAWYRGEQVPPALPRDYAPAFERLRQMARTAFARLLVDAIAERFEIQGVRTTSGTDADNAAWRLLQDNHVDADQHDVHAEALITGCGYVSIAGSGEDVRITPETSLEVTHEHAPGDRRLVTSALKLLELEPRVWQVELYLPNRTVVWVAEYQSTRALGPLAEPARAPWSEDPLELPNELGAVPVVPFENRPTAASHGVSELDELVPVLQRIQELELAKLVAAHTAVFRQKWATGLEVPRDPESGKPVEPFNAALDRLWVSEDPDSKFGTFEASDVQQYLAAIDAEIAELTAVSRVPSYYLVQSNLANPPSAESLVASESGLVTRVLDGQRAFGESWELVVRLGASAAGVDELAGDRELEVLWRSPERRNPAVVADAATKLQACGVPQEYVWAFLGYSPQAIERMRVLAAAEALAAPAPVPAA